MENSKIKWTDHTFNPWIGCQKVSPGCDHCYAEAQNAFRKRNGGTWGPHAPRKRTSDTNWKQPLKWNAEADAFKEKHGHRPRVFCASLADVFDNKAPSAWREDLFELIRECEQLDWLLLTKRPQNILKMLPSDWGDGYPNVWLGMTAEDVLKVISNSPGDLEPVFVAMLANAVRICGANFGNIYRWSDDALHLLATHNTPPAFAEVRRNSPFRPGPDTPTGRMVATKTMTHVADLAAEPRATEQDDRDVRFGVDVGGIRTLLSVPMLKDDELVGAFTIYRQEVRPFTDKQIELVQNFAAQAVIAIENTRLLSELRESLARQTATSEVLEVISSSPGELIPVFNAMLENATRICEAKFGNLFLYEAGAYRAVAVHGASNYAEWTRREPIVDMTESEHHGTPLFRLLRDRTLIHITDLRLEEGYISGNPRMKSLVETAGARTHLVVPMLKDEELIGAIVMYRQEVRPFTEKQIALVQNFAAQAVIAIENTRLLNELRESLDQQTATSEVLKVISSSPGDLQPVFDAMLDNAVRICDAQFGVMHRFEGEQFYATAMLNAPQALDEFLRKRGSAKAIPGSDMDILSKSRQVVHTIDMLESPAPSPPAKLAGARTQLAVPMLLDDALIGAIVIFRQEVRPFTDKQIELVKNFASQAVIAIENTRLLNELRQRTDDLSESLEQQTATSEVLRIISSSPGELEPVFQAMLANAVRICDAKFGVMFRHNIETFTPAAFFDAPAALAEFIQQRKSFQPIAGTNLDRMWRTKEVIRVIDDSVEPVPSPAAKFGGARSLIAVPMLKEDVLIGGIVIYRQEVRPFTDKQIELVSNFAAQSVIAIENTRLLSELRESLEQQTATSEVLQVISSSPGELEPVFNSMLSSATRLCDASFGNLLLWEGDAFRMAAVHGDLPPAVKEKWQPGILVRPGPDVPVMRAGLTRNVVQVADLREESCYRNGEPLPVLAVESVGARALIAIPMVKESELVGAIVIYRQEVRPFSDKQIELVTNFAAQAVIAIENARLLNELRQRTDDLSESLEQQTATSKVLEVISRSAFDLTAVFETVAESSVKLCGADHAFIFRFDGELLRVAATFNTDPEFKKWVEQNPIRPGRHSGAARAALERRTIHIPDVLADPEYLYGAKNVEAIRTILGVPIIKGEEFMGVIMIFRLEVRPFTEKQIALVETFADQAAIAIENMRLFAEVQSRTRELSKSVDELRALGEVSQAVNSTLDLENVLSTIVAKAVQLSGTEAGAIYVFDNTQREFHLRATYGMDQELINALASQHIGLDEPNVALAFAQSEPTQVADLRQEAASELNEITLRAGYRARLVAPLTRGEDVVGILVVRRRTAGQFEKSTVDLIKTFAAQSALAIQNARLFENVETRTRELGKSLDDLRTAQDRLVQTEKLASLGQLTAGIAHEIKNPLNFVNNFSAISVELIDELREALAGANLDVKLRAEINEVADMLQGNLDKVVQHGKRADSIVKNMLLHSRQGSQEHRPVDINAIVEESLNLAYHGARAEKQGFNITLERSLDPTAGEVDLFPQEITRVLLNLISNGFYAATKRKADANGGNYEPTLAASTKNLGDSVEIRIRDNGTGIPPGVKEKMFNPFFTTKPVGEGTGLGLSISHDIIVKQHGGSIEVDTKPGEFTEFRIVLPRSAATIAKSGQRP